MNVWEAILLGLIQGLTEFLPVSSSAHLEIAHRLLGRSSGFDGLLFSVTVHSATAISTLIVLRKPLFDWFRGLFGKDRGVSLGFGRTIAISLIPAVVVGFFFDESVSGLFEGQLSLMGALMVLSGLLLYLAHRSSGGRARLGLREGFILGIAQALAIFPGLSRPGMTISSALILGIERRQAAEFSFLMVVPVILAKFVLDFRNLWMSARAGFEFELPVPALIAGFAVALITGVFSCRIAIKIVERGRFIWLSVYCMALGTALAFWGLYEG